MDWSCHYCGSTDPEDIRWAASKYKTYGHCRQCRQAFLHHIPWTTYIAWRTHGCAICGMKEHADKRRKRMLEVDHDHSCCPNGTYSCGRCIRGLVCHPHNQLIRQIEDGTVARVNAYLDHGPPIVT